MEHVSGPLTMGSRRAVPGQQGVRGRNPRRGIRAQRSPPLPPLLPAPALLALQAGIGHQTIRLAPAEAARV